MDETLHYLQVNELTALRSEITTRLQFTLVENEELSAQLRNAHSEKDEMQLQLSSIGSVCRL